MERLQRVFEAERRARHLVEDAEVRAKEMEAEARSRGEEAVKAAEAARRDALAGVKTEAEQVAASRRTVLMAELDREEARWRERFESLRGPLADRVIDAVIGLEDLR